MNSPLLRLVALPVVLATATAASGCGMSLETASLGPSSKPDMQVGRPLTAYKQVLVPPMVGLPAHTQDQVVRSLNTAAMPLDIALLRQGEATVVLRGYANAAVTKGKVSVEYFWDIQGQTPPCTGRNQGSDTASASGADPWAAVTPAMLDKMAQKGLDLVKTCVGAAPAGSATQPAKAVPPPKT